MASTKLAHRSLFALIFFAIVAPLNAQTPTDAIFTRNDAMIAMRDGVRLYTQVYTPAQEYAQPQRSSWNGRHELRGLANRDGNARSTSGA